MSEREEAAAKAQYEAVTGKAWEDAPPRSAKLCREDSAAIAEAIDAYDEAHGVHKSLKPRAVTTVEELDALADPVTILMDYCGHPYQWGISMDGSEGWMAPHDQTPITSRHLWRLAPITVLYEPTA